MLHSNTFHPVDCTCIWRYSWYRGSWPILASFRERKRKVPSESLDRHENVAELIHEWNVSLGPVLLSRFRGPTKNVALWLICYVLGSGSATKDDMANGPTDEAQVATEFLRIVEVGSHRQAVQPNRLLAPRIRTPETSGDIYEDFNGPSNEQLRSGEYNANFERQRREISGR